MLRVCALPQYRYSEDLDFDWLDSPTAFHKKYPADFVNLRRIGSERLRLSPGISGAAGKVVGGWSQPRVHGLDEATKMRKPLLKLAWVHDPNNSERVPSFCIAASSGG